MPGSIKKYSNFQVVLHWATALLVMFMLVMGTFSLAETPNTDPEKIFAFRGHMILGGLILVLTVIRLVWRWKHVQPPHASTGNALLDKAGVAMHHTLYFMLILLVLSGISLAVLSGLPDIVFGGAGALPESFFIYPPRYVHGIATKLIAGLVLLHLVGALYHQFVMKDKLFSRMWFGRNRG